MMAGVTETSSRAAATAVSKRSGVALTRNSRKLLELRYKVRTSGDQRPPPRVERRPAALQSPRTPAEGHDAVVLGP
jgi:hypothetical protein